MRSLHSLLALFLFIPALVTAQNNSPRQVADELLAADRAFAAASAKTALVTALSALFAGEVAMPAPNGIAYGSQKAIEALKANPANIGAKAEWVPARVAVSGDGQHGFTAGFMTITRADGTVNPAKYLAYWEKQSQGWRALVYKRTPAKAAAPSMAVGYVLPKQIVPAKADAKAIETSRESLADAERAFSRDAQTLGIGPAFKKYGSPDAINLAGPETLTFVIGNAAIGENVGSDAPPNTSPVHWGPEKTIIAASGDFGVTIGYIVRNQPGADPSTSSGQAATPPGQPGAPAMRTLHRGVEPFFTIWRKDADGVWRYIAE